MTWLTHGLSIVSLFALVACSEEVDENTEPDLGGQVGNGSADGTGETTESSAMKDAGTPGSATDEPSSEDPPSGDPSERPAASAADQDAGTNMAETEDPQSAEQNEGLDAGTGIVDAGTTATGTDDPQSDSPDAGMMLADAGTDGGPDMPFSRMVVGTVLGSDGLPLEAAEIYLPSSETFLSEAKTTDSLGQFSLPDATGTYSLLVRLDPAANPFQSDPGTGTGDHVLYYEGLTVEQPVLVHPSATSRQQLQISGTVTYPEALADRSAADVGLYGLFPGELPFDELNVQDASEPPGSGLLRSFSGSINLPVEPPEGPFDLRFATIPDSSNHRWAPVYHGVIANITPEQVDPTQLQVVLDQVVPPQDLRFSDTISDNSPDFADGTVEATPWAMAIAGQRVQLAESSSRRFTPTNSISLNGMGVQYSEFSSPIAVAETTTHLLVSHMAYASADATQRAEGLNFDIDWGVNRVVPYAPSVVDGVEDLVQVLPSPSRPIAFSSPTPDLEADSLGWTGSEGATAIIVHAQLADAPPLRAVLPGDATELDLRPYRSLFQDLPVTCTKWVEVAAVYGLSYSPDKDVNGEAGTLLGNNGVHSLGPRARAEDSLEIRRVLYTDYTCFGQDESCFVAGTRVLTPDGLRSIDSMAVGDAVLSYDLASDEIQVGTVLRVLVREASELFALSFGEQTVKVTGEHPFFVEGSGWTAVRKLFPGDVLRTSSGESLELADIQRLEGSETVYNITVDGNHNYFVSEAGILVHNK